MYVSSPYRQFDIYNNPPPDHLSQDNVIRAINVALRCILAIIMRYFASCIFSGLGTPFDSVSWGRVSKACKMLPHPRRVATYPAGSSAYPGRPAWAADGIVIWQTQGPASGGLPVKPRLHIRTNPWQTRRGFLFHRII